MLITENSQKPPFLDEHADKKITIRKHFDRKFIDGDVGIEGEYHNSGEIQGSRTIPYTPL